MTEPSQREASAAWLRRGVQLEWITLGWNIVGVVILAYLALTASSVALAGFGLDSLIEIGASAVVLWELSGTGADRRRRALLLIGVAFVALALYLAVQSVAALITRRRASRASSGRRSRRPSCFFWPRGSVGQGGLSPTRCLSQRAASPSSTDCWPSRF